MNTNGQPPLRVLWVSNDLPPRRGGIQSFIGALLNQTFVGTTHVIGPAGPPDAHAFDATQPYTTSRLSGRVLPTRATLRHVFNAAATHRAELIILGALWPLGELAGPLTRTLNIPVMALSHGHEAGLMQVGGAPLIRRATRHLAGLTTIATFTETKLAPANQAAATFHLPPGVDTDRFSPDAGPRPACLEPIPFDAPIVGGVSRLVVRKGFDRLIDAWGQISAAHPDAWLVIAGDGPDRSRLERLVDKTNGRQVLFTGATDHTELPALYSAFSVFAAPVRTRNLGLDVEGLGMVFLEAQACGVPLVVGNSGGAPETVCDPSYGTVVDGRNPNAIATAVTDWLADPLRCDIARQAARSAAVTHWSWELITTRFQAISREVTARYHHRQV
ncbi:MAG: glycosyltransferase family 4 protein [Nitriliruptoraceae bacterium]